MNQRQPLPLMCVRKALHEAVGLAMRRRHRIHLRQLLAAQQHLLSPGGGTLISDLRTANDEHHTWLQVTYVNGEQNVFVLENSQ